MVGSVWPWGDHRIVDDRYGGAHFFNAWRCVVRLSGSLLVRAHLGSQMGHGGGDGSSHGAYWCTSLSEVSGVARAAGMVLDIDPVGTRDLHAGLGELPQRRDW